MKCGSGAFMKTSIQSTQLAREMVDIGRKCNRNVSAFVTDMSTPVGYAIGNKLEVIEAVDVLKGRDIPDLKKLSLTLSAEMISLSLNINTSVALCIAKRMLESGKAFEKFKEMVVAQGGDVRCIQDTSFLLSNTYSLEIIAENDGYIYELDALLLGKAFVVLGAGRNIKTDNIDYDAGIVLSVKKGDKISKGNAIMTLYSSKESKLKDAEILAKASYEISNIAPQNEPLIIDYIR